MAQPIDEVEDLTRFADESFDTDDVDLFEFTGVDDSPLTRLKSIILSLDWEISDDILDELTDEVTNLRKMWEDDKVAQVYLQGIEKVGKYLRVEGAYAHHNAMKLLLTLFYNYEKIISSPNISGDEITALLKSDIRKFKVLQYQIGKQAPSAKAKTQPPEADLQEDPSLQADAELDILADLNATILGLEWEVTEEGLDRFNKQANQLEVELADNKSGLVLVNGLQALGSYIQEQKVKAHPDSFTLLHSFFDGLKKLLSSQHMTSEKRQEILIDRVSQLNALKEVIAGAAVSGVAQTQQFEKVDEILDFDEPEESFESEIELTETPEDIDEGIEDVFDSPVPHEDENELDLDFDLEHQELDDAQGLDIDLDEDIIASLSDDDVIDISDKTSEDYVATAMKTADEQYPDDILDPGAIHPVSNKIADDFIEEELHSSTVVPSLTDVSQDDFADLSLDDDALNADELDEELDLLFGTDSEDAEGSLDTLDDDLNDFEIELEDAGIEEPDSLDFSEELEGVDLDKESELLLDDDLFLDDADNVPGDEEILEENALTDIPDIIDSPVVESKVDEVESTTELEGQIDSLFGSAEEEKHVETESSDFDSIIPALDDSDEESGFREEVVAEGIAEDPSADLEGRLDSFFGISEEEPDIEEMELPAASQDPVYQEPEDDFVVAALSDTDEDDEGGFQEDRVVAELEEDPSNDLQDKLDSFFGSDDESEASGFDSTESTTPIDAAVGGIDEKLDTLFGGKTAATAAVLSLGAVAAKISSVKPSQDDLQQVAQLVAEKKNDNPGTQETVILTLMNSATELIAANTEIASDTGNIIEELNTYLDDAENPAAMIAAVECFTAWQKKLYDKALQQKTKPVTAQGSGELDEQIASQVKENFSQLRETLLNEFAEIRKELKKE